jgi:hypothetical protein
VSASFRSSSIVDSSVRSNGGCRSSLQGPHRVRAGRALLHGDPSDRCRSPDAPAARSPARLPPGVPAPAPRRHLRACACNDRNRQKRLQEANTPHGCDVCGTSSMCSLKAHTGFVRPCKWPYFSARVGTGVGTLRVRAADGAGVTVLWPAYKTAWLLGLRRVHGSRVEQLGNGTIEVVLEGDPHDRAPDGG